MKKSYPRASSPEPAAPLARHHSDPFDRLLVAHALVETMLMLIHDSQLARYSDSVAVV